MLKLLSRSCEFVWKNGTMLSLLLIIERKQRISLNKQRLLNALFVAKGLKMLPHCQNS